MYNQSTGFLSGGTELVEGDRAYWGTELAGGTELKSTQLGAIPLKNLEKIAN
jgi:hypothetical protein